LCLLAIRSQQMLNSGVGLSDGGWWGFSLGERLSSSNLWRHHSPYTLMRMPMEGLIAPAQLRYLAQ